MGRHPGSCISLLEITQILYLKPCTDLVSNLLAIDWRLVRIACDGLQQKFQHAEYFMYNPLIS